MSDFGRPSTSNNLFGRPTTGGTFGRPDLPGQKPLTEAQAEIAAYMKIIEGEEGKEGKRFKPVQAIFDLLSRGQYVSANAVDAVLDNLNEDEPMDKQIFDVLGAMKRGITGEQKGSYADVIKEHATGDFKEWTEKDLFSWNGVDKRSDDKFLGQATVADLLGFAGDVFLDPLTYVGGGLAGKSTKASKAAAGQFARDSVQVAVKNMVQEGTEGGVTALQRLATAGIDAGTFARKAKKGGTEAAEYVLKNSTGDVSRQLNDIYKASYKQALNTPAAELEGVMRQAIDPLRQAETARQATRYDSLVSKPLEGVTDVVRLQDNIDEAAAAMKNPNVLTDIWDKLTGRYGSEAMGGAGQRYRASIFGKELGVGTRQAGAVSRGMERFGNYVKQSGPGSKLANGWWSLMNNSAIGEVRKAMGIRNPYEKFIRMQELQEGSEFFLREAQKNMQTVLNATQKYSDEAKDALVKAMGRAETLNRKSKGSVTVFDVLKNKPMLSKLDIPEGIVSQVDELAKGVQNITRNWSTEYAEWAGKGYVDKAGVLDNYLPTIIKDPAVKKNKGIRKIGSSQAPGFSKKRTYSMEQVKKMERDKFQWLYKDLNLSDAEVDKLITTKMKGGETLTGHVMDLDELLAARAYSQAMVAKRANLLETFKEFGVPIDAAQNKFLKGGVLKVDELGLATIKDEKALGGYLFDKSVVDVFGRIAESTTAKNLPKLRNAFKGYTSWWKGIVTMTPGFHARNWLSNQMTGFVNHGAKWLDPKNDMDALAGTIYAITRNNPDDILGKIGMSLPQYQKSLSKTIGGESVKELADRAIRTGLISEAQMGYSAKDALTSMGKKMSANPVSTEFVGRRVSQKAGSVIENSSKFKSFLLTFDDIMKEAPEGVAKTNFTETAFKAANMDAKKWFIDYEDLTPFERETMKTVIPFYSWLRHNIANQMEAMVYHPDIYAMFPKVNEFLAIEDPNYDSNLLPEWMKGEGMFPTGTTEEGDLLVYRPDIPVMDLNMLPFEFEQGEKGWMTPKWMGKDLKDELVNAMHPAIKWVASRMTEKGYDFFKKMDLGEFEDAPYTLQLLLGRPETIGFIDGLLQSAGVEGGLDVNKDGDKLQMDARFMQTLNSAAPFLRQLDYLIYTGTGVIPGLEETIEEVSTIKDKYDKLDQTLQLISYYTGIKRYGFQPEEAKEQKSRSRYYEARDRRTAANKKLPGAETRRDASREKTDDLIRRLEDAFR